MVHEEHAQVGQVVHVEEFPQGRAVPPAGDVWKPLLLCLVEPPYQRGQHMAVGGMVVVIGAV